MNEPDPTNAASVRTPCFFATDLHGRPGRYRALAAAVLAERPRAVFLGGDLFPHEMARVESLPRGGQGFLDGLLAPCCASSASAWAGTILVGS